MPQLNTPTCPECSTLTLSEILWPLGAFAILCACYSGLQFFSASSLAPTSNTDLQLQLLQSTKRAVVSVLEDFRVQAKSSQSHVLSAADFETLYSAQKDSRGQQFRYETTLDAADLCSASASSLVVSEDPRFLSVEDAAFVIISPGLDGRFGYAKRALPSGKVMIDTSASDDVYSFARFVDAKYALCKSRVR